MGQVWISEGCIYWKLPPVVGGVFYVRAARPCRGAKEGEGEGPVEKVRRKVPILHPPPR